MNTTAWDLSMVPSQKNKVAIVTGANTGLGFETAKALASKDMKVILACRNILKAKKAKVQILESVPNAIIECREIDLSKLKSVRTFASSFLKDYQQLDLLINNAGIMVPPFSLTEDGFESQMGANYFGHFLLTQLLLETITNTPNSRIVSLSSIAHKTGKIQFEDINYKKEYSAFKAYGQSKLACLIFAVELERRLKKAGSQTISVAAHPGISTTELDRFLPKWTALVYPIVKMLMTHTPDKGALPTLRAALDEKVKGGEYYGPNGTQEYRGRPVQVKPKSKALNKELASELWQISEELTDCSYRI